MHAIENIINGITGILWGPFMLVLLVGGGVFLTFRLRFLQFRYFRYIFSQTFGSFFKKNKSDSEKKGTISPFQAVAAELASTVGASNIIGVTVAIFFGGPGALFWMWVTAFVGMATKYSEIVLGILYREKDKNNVWVGGPMYYIKKGLKSPFLANAISFFFMLEIFSSIMVQSNSAAGSATSLGVKPWISGVFMSLMIGLIIVGGIKRLGQVSEIFVPFMCGLYTLGSLVIILAHITDIPSVFVLIIKSAFTTHAAVGGFAGSTILLALRWGTARGLYSNEAGMGTAPIAHSAAITDHPTRQAFWGVISVFIDTIVIGSVTGFVILLSGIWKVTGLQASAMAAQAFTNFYGPLGATIVNVSLLMFVISTIYVIAFYGEKMAFFLFGRKFSLVMRGVYIAACFIGAVGGLKVLWLFLDVLLAFVVIPNIISVLVLSPKVVEKTREFFHVSWLLFKR